MNAPTYLKPWLANRVWGSRIALILILLSAVVQFVTFALSQNYVVSYLGVQAEDVNFSIQICYAGIISMLPIQFRLTRYFEMKYYLLFVMFLGILLAVACISTSNITLFFIIRFFQGLVVCCIAGAMLTLIPTFLKTEYRLVIGSSIFYCTVLSSGVLVGIVASLVSLNADFTNIYYYLIIFQILTMGIVLSGFSSRSMIKPYPLYQIDWVGAVFFITAALGLAYTMIYGSKYYWFADKRIIIATLITGIAIMLYLFKSLILKRPLISLCVFKYPSFWVGIILLALYYGMKESINLVFGYTASVLQWSSLQIMMLGLFNDAGLILFMIISAWLMIRRKDLIVVFLISGFCMLLLYHVWIYLIFTPDLAFTDLLLPVFLQGAASGLLFTPIMIFIITSVPPTTGFTGLTVAAYARFISLLNAGAGFYNLQLFYNQLYRESFLAHLTGVDNQATNRLDDYQQIFQSKGYPADQASALANASLAKALSVQGQLLSIRSIFLFISFVIIIILVIITLFSVVKFYLYRRQTRLNTPTTL